MFTGHPNVRPLLLVVIATAAACSPSVSTPSRGDALNGSGGTGAPGGSGNDGLGGGAATGPAIIDVAQGGKTSTGPDGSCAATTAMAERRVVETQVPVTTQVVTRTPVALYFMQDQSGSMVMSNIFQFPPPPTKWAQTKAALTAFVQDPGSAGIDVALQYFALAAGGCDGANYITPEVAMAPLPANAQPIIDSLAAHNPFTQTPIEPALRGVTQYCIQYQKTHTTEKCIAVLITDGAPSTCDLTAAGLEQIASDAYAPPNNVVTFTVGMDGADFNMLNGIAIAGHSDCTLSTAGNEACNVTAGGTAFIDALNTIRGSVTTSETHLETHQEIQQTKLSCEFELPSPPDGQKFDKDKVNVDYTAAGGTQQIYQVPTLGDCAAAGNKGWYYDSVDQPTKILVCPGTCADIGGNVGGDGGTVVNADPPTRVDIAFGCATKRGAA
jgi:hypothetical protein